jgi:hypothetical protein
MSVATREVEFRYRFVPYGTKFTSAAGLRLTAQQERRETLFDNEVVADVGGVCWGYDNEALPVLDHHFFRESGQFPSASAAVVHNAERLRDYSEALRKRNEAAAPQTPAIIWLVTHVQPDFDALASLYLIRKLLEGKLPFSGWQEFGIRSEGWFGGRDEIDWYRPCLSKIPADRRWAVLVAAEASRTDNCRTARCPRNRRLASVLCAAIERGRPYMEEQNGAVDFFDEVRILLTHGASQGLDPYFDSIMDQSHVFRAELSLLDREAEAYARDLQRARKMIVYVPEAKTSFSDWFPEVAKVPLLDSQREIQPIHLGGEKHGRQAVDGLFLRDPESLLFKSWARSDTEQSTFGSGFKFTAIVNSSGRPAGESNTGDYYFSLDPENAGRMHLYPIWARLQKLEVDEFVRRELAVEPPRSGFEDRAISDGGTYHPHYPGFGDPWFDGNNYGCTIVPTPNRGSSIGPAGKRSDLSDDPVVQIVLEELTESVFGQEILLQDFPGNAQKAAQAIPKNYTRVSQVPPVGTSGYRFLRVKLDNDIDLRSPELVKQIATRLWRCLDDNVSDMSAANADQHLFRGDDWLGIWNERGVAVSYRPNAEYRAKELQNLFEKVCTLAHSMRLLIERAKNRTKPDEIEEQLARSDELLIELALRGHDITLPENVLVRRFFEASRLDRSLAMVRDIHASAADRLEAERVRELAQSQNQIASKMNDSVATLVSLQQKLEYVEVGIVLVYAAEMTHILSESFDFSHFYTGIGVIVCPFFAALAAYWWLIGSSDHGHSHAHEEKSRGPSIGTIATIFALILVVSLFFGAGLTFSSLRKPPDAKNGSTGH